MRDASNFIQHPARVLAGAAVACRCRGGDVVKAVDGRSREALGAAVIRVRKSDAAGDAGQGRIDARARSRRNRGAINAVRVLNSARLWKLASDQPDTTTDADADADA